MSTEDRTMTRPRAAVLLVALGLHGVAAQAWHECSCDTLDDEQCAPYRAACIERDRVAGELDELRSSDERLDGIALELVEPREARAVRLTAAANR